MCSAIPRRIAVTGSSCSPAAPRPCDRAAPARRAGEGGAERRGCGRGRRRRGGGAGWAGRRLRAREPAARARPDSTNAEDVLLRHAAAAAGARHLARVDAVLGGDARDDRRDERPAVAARRRRRGAVRRAPARLRLGGLLRLRGRRDDASARRRRRLGRRLLGRGLGRRLARRPARARRHPRARSPRASSRPRPSRPRRRGSARRRRCPGSGTSVSTLSVEISSSASSASTVSPSCFSHFVTVPSETETPICGMTTSIAVSVVAMTPP